MTRVPLRPLARILRARDVGDDPAEIEAENIRRRHDEMREGIRRRSELRMRLLGLCAVAAFAMVGLRMWAIAAEPVTEPVVPLPPQVAALEAAGQPEELVLQGSGEEQR